MDGDFKFHDWIVRVDGRIQRQHSASDLSKLVGEVGKAIFKVFDIMDSNGNQKHNIDVFLLHKPSPRAG